MELLTFRTPGNQQDVPGFARFLIARKDKRNMKSAEMYCLQYLMEKF